VWFVNLLTVVCKCFSGVISGVVVGVIAGVVAGLVAVGTGVLTTFLEAVAAI